MATDISLTVETTALAMYRLWLRPAGTAWRTLAPRQVDQSQSARWVMEPPLGAGSEFAHSFGVWGHPDDCWLVGIAVSQRLSNSSDSSWDVCHSWLEGGMLDDNGHGGAVASLAAASRVSLVSAFESLQRQRDTANLTELTL
jgi:hypothetical protein